MSNHISTVAYVFPGQGAQVVGMGKALAEAFPEARQAFLEADEALGLPLSTLCFEGPEAELNLTVNTQPAILATSVAALRALLAAGGAEPAFVAGHSLGEYSALVAAGALSFPDAVRLVRRRGEWMEQAVPAGQGAMAVILGLDNGAVAEVCREATREAELVEPANFNCPGQVTIAGHTPAVQRAMEIALARGASRAIRLPVSGPFHSSLMRPAAEALRAELARTPVQDPAIPVVANVSASPVATAAEVVEALGRQVDSPVLWEQSVRWMLAQGVRTFVEIGPGRALSGMLKRIDKSAEALNVEGPQDLEKVLARQKGVM